MRGIQQHVGILSVGRYLPDYIMTNQELETKIDTSDEWIRTRTGIEERRIAPPEMKTSDMAVYAALDALEKSNITADKIDFIIVATATPDYAFPSVACSVQERIGAKKAFAFDISAACSGFIYALVTAQQFIESGRHQYGLVIGAEKYSAILDWTDRNTCVLFGDGAGAVLVGPVAKEKGILSYDLGADGSGMDHLYVEQVLHMNGREIFKFAVRKMGESALQALQRAGIEKDDVDFLIPHQANIRIIDAVRTKLELPTEKVSVTVNKYGNTSAASIILSLYEELEQNRIQEDDTVVFVGFGGGLTWGAVVMKWAMDEKKRRK